MGFDDLIELRDGRVPHKFQDMKFSTDSFDIGNIFDFIFLQYFDGHRLPCILVQGFFNFAERSFPDCLSEWE